MSVKDPITTVEAAQILGLTTARVRQLVLAGMLPDKKFGRENMIERADVLALKKQRSKRKAA